jgi:hypothetical protein
MDQDQQPQPLPLLEFTETQVMLLTQLYHDLTATLADWTFSDPEKDHLIIRQHAAVAGKREQIKQLLSHDTEVMAAAQERADEQRAQQFSQNQE